MYIKSRVSFSMITKKLRVVSIFVLHHLFSGILQSPAPDLEQMNATLGCNTYVSKKVSTFSGPPQYTEKLLDQQRDTELGYRTPTTPNHLS
jgi:hypothetical protein